MDMNRFSNSGRISITPYACGARLRFSSALLLAQGFAPSRRRKADEETSRRGQKMVAAAPYTTLAAERVRPAAPVSDNIDTVYMKHMGAGLFCRRLISHGQIEFDDSENALTSALIHVPYSGQNDRQATGAQPSAE